MPADIPWQNWLLALGGGLLIGGASALFLWLDGRIAGVTGLLAAALRNHEPERSVSRAFVLGLVLGGALLQMGAPQVFGQGGTSLPLAAGAGLLVGFGTRLGNGCTSGHGVCGLSRRSPRSLAAVLTFMGAGMVTVGLTRALLGGTP